MHVPDDANSNKEDGLKPSHYFCLPQKACSRNADPLPVPIRHSRVFESRYMQIQSESRDEQNSK